jgi:excisionase family DNA binding protein
MQLKIEQVIKNDKSLFNLAEVCKITGKCYSTIHRAIKEGKLKSVRLGGSIMVRKDELERILIEGWSTTRTSLTITAVTGKLRVGQLLTGSVPNPGMKIVALSNRK